MKSEQISLISPISGLFLVLYSKVMQTIQVTAAIITQNGRVLIAQRHPDDTMGGKWEFPGGKIEPDETPEACLQRELHEELGIIVEVHDEFAVSRYDAPDRRIELVAYTATIRDGDIMLNEHSDVRWVTVDELDQFDMCAADRPFVEQLRAKVFRTAKALL